MNSDMNKATRRLLQVILDMLSNPNHAEETREREAKIAAGEKYPGNVPSRYRCDFLAVEAAWRAANQAQQMLADDTLDPGYTVEVPVFGSAEMAGTSQPPTKLEVR